MNKCTYCPNEPLCTFNKIKENRANCLEPKDYPCFEPKNYPSYLDNPKPTRKQTNYDRMRNMSIEEMAEFINTISRCGEISCKDCCLPPQSCGNAKNIEKWLMSESNKEDD